MVLGAILFFSANGKITPEEAEKLCYTVMCEKEEDTGFPFSFGVTGTYEKDGETGMKYFLLNKVKELSYENVKQEYEKLGMDCESKTNDVNK